MNFDSYDIRRVVVAIDHQPLAVCLAALAMFAILAVTIGCGRRLIGCAARHGWQGEKVGTLLAAAIATGVSAQGMWVFMGDTLNLAIALRVMFFGFLETMTITSAMRARTAQRVTGAAGIDGIAMWVLTSLSAVLSATEADNLGTLLIRLIAPLVAAWGWERSMALERRLHIGHSGRINWRITPERLLIRLGLADPDPQRSKSDDAAQRSLVAVAFAVDDARVLRGAAKPNLRKLRKAQQRLRQAMRRATADGGLIPFVDRDRREVLLDHIAVLSATSTLLDVEVPNPWQAPGQHQIPVLRSDAQQAKQDTDEPAPARPATTPPTSAVSPGSGPALNGQASRPPAYEAWATVAEQVCADDPARRRRPHDVEAILRLHHVEHCNYPQIARQVDGFSKHAVGRVIRQARKYQSTQHANAGRGGRP